MLELGKATQFSLTLDTAVAIVAPLRDTGASDKAQQPRSRDREEEESDSEPAKAPHKDRQASVICFLYLNVLERSGTLWFKLLCYPGTF